MNVKLDNERGAGAWLRGLVQAALLIAVLACPFSRASAETFDDRVHATLAFIEQQLLATVAELADPNAYPKTPHPVTGEWITTAGSGWASG